MFIYEHESTKVIVLRLRALSTLLRLAVIAISVVFMGAFLSLVNEYITKNTWWVGGLLGVIVGLAFGMVFAAAVVAVIEWMAQMVVAQGEILESLRKRE